MIFKKIIIFVTTEKKEQTDERCKIEDLYNSGHYDSVLNLLEILKKIIFILISNN